jgi:hypothetical protein
MPRSKSKKRSRAATKAAETRRRNFAEAIAAVGGKHEKPELGRPRGLLPPAKPKPEAWCTCAFLADGSQLRHESGCPKGDDSFFNR